MIGHKVRKVLAERLRKESEKQTVSEIKHEQPVKRYEHFKQIPLDRCEICNKKQAPGLPRNYHWSTRLYRHHVMPKEIYGRNADKNCRRDEFVVCCGKCHNYIHRTIRIIRKLRDEMIESDYYLAIDLTKISRKKVIDLSHYTTEQQELATKIIENRYITDWLKEIA